MAIEYRLCAAATAAELNEEVNELLRDGWALYGNPFFSLLKNTPMPAAEAQAGMLCQALTKLPKKVAGVR
jgi:hypothetical protein